MRARLAPRVGRTVRGPVASLLRVTSRVMVGAAAELRYWSSRVTPVPRCGENEEFRGLHAGRRAFVIGNGSSLQTQDLNRLDGELLFTMNAFHKHPLCLRRPPTYHFLADPLYFDGSESSKRFLSDLTSTCPGTTLFVPVSAVPSFRAACERTGVRLRGLPFVGDFGTARTPEIDLCRRIPGCQSVSQSAIVAAMFMGCSPIVLLGMDHDWAAHRGPDRHFYQGKTFVAHPGEVASLAEVGYREDLESLVRLWRGYERLRDWAAASGFRIVNATNGGFLDVFERVTLDEVLGR
jgi:hypothetical protein